MDQIFEMRTFVRVVERQSFSVAAEELGLSPSAVSKLIARVEDRLGVRLLHRTTRRLALTPEGETFNVRARDILAAIEDAEAEVSRAGQTPRGRLRVNSVTAFALHELSAALPDFLQRYPGIELELAASDRVVDLIAEHMDVGIRTGKVEDPSLVVRKITDIHRGLFASPEYLARKGTPTTPEELGNHDCIVLSWMASWPFRDGADAKVFQPASRIVVDNSETALRLALAGSGIVRLSDVLVGAAVRDRRLVPLMTEAHVTEKIPLSAVYPLGRHHMAKVRVFLDFLVERFGAAPWRIAIPPLRDERGRNPEGPDARPKRTPAASVAPRAGSRGVARSRAR